MAALLAICGRCALARGQITGEGQNTYGDVAGEVEWCDIVGCLVLGASEDGTGDNACLNRREWGVS